MAKDYSDDIRRLSTAKRTHFTHFTAPAMPWHTEDHKFGESSEKPIGNDVPNDNTTPEEPGGDRYRDSAFDEKFQGRLPDPGVDEGIEQSIRAIRDSLPSPYVTLVESGRCYYCPEPAVYGSGSKLYCLECWSAVKEDEENAYRWSQRR